MPERLHPLKLVSVLLQYPTEELRDAAAAVGEFAIAPARGRQTTRLREFCGWYASRDVGELERLYIDAFDFTKQCSLHVSYHVHGDRRQRGVAMLEIKRAYRASGFEPPGAELPDYLPLMLEFAALAPDRAGEALLEDHRIALELIHAGLRRDASPFTPLLEVVLATLGRLSSHKLARVRRLAVDGPPSESVGLEPFAPPEVMPPDGHGAAAGPLVGGGEAR